MGTITGTLTIELVWNKQKKLGVSWIHYKNIRTINEIHNLRNSKNIVRK